MQNLQCLDLRLAGKDGKLATFLGPRRQGCRMERYHFDTDNPKNSSKKHRYITVIQLSFTFILVNKSTGTNYKAVSVMF